MQAFLTAAVTLPLVTSAIVNPHHDDRAIINVRASYIGDDPNLGYDAETEATNKALTALAESAGLSCDNGAFDADGTEVWYYAPIAA